MYNTAFGLCYQIVPKFKVNVGSIAGFYIVMNTTLNDTNDLPKSVKVFITSKSNSYGLAIDSWVEGNSLDFNLPSSEKPKEVFIDLKPTEYKMYQPTSNCYSDESFYKCRGLRLLQKEQYKNCNRFCIPITYQTLIKLATNNSFEICENPLENACMTSEMAKIELQENCSKSCTIIEYDGKVKYQDSMNQNGMGDWYMTFLTSELTFIEEYLIYDFIGMVGSIGGTLGLFIGFSFMDLFFWIVNILFKK